jgi:hypothetical protein
MNSVKADVAVVGGGLGACAAALGAARHGFKVVLTEETHWIGGQLTNQLVPPDEHPWIEECGATASYRTLRNRIRRYYRTHLPLTREARATIALNPGNGWVSRLCHDPRVALAVLHEMLAPYELNGRLLLMPHCRLIAAQTHNDRITCTVVKDLESGFDCLIEAPFFVDATPLGDLLALAGVEHVVGAESRSDTGEPHASEYADPRGQQAITVCFAMEHLSGEDHTINKPPQYEFWRDYVPPGWPGRLFSWTAVRPETLAPLSRGLFESDDGKPWWTFRRILDRKNFREGFAESDVTIVNWPQNDYWLEPIAGVDELEQARSVQAARELSLSLFYWLQTEAPRPDGGQGYKGLRIRRDVAGGTSDGLAPAPYIRESRRIRAERTVTELDIAHPLRPHGPEKFEDSVGIGWYRIDLHPRANGANYLDLGCWPYQIPLGSLIPIRIENLLPGGKNLGVTHIANGAFRLHPVEWNVGETAGTLTAFCLQREVTPRAVRNRSDLLHEFQALLQKQGVELAWQSLLPL